MTLNTIPAGLAKVQETWREFGDHIAREHFRDLQQQAMHNIIHNFFQAEERLVRRMMNAWDFAAWGEPCIAMKPPPAVRWDAPPEEKLCLTSRIVGLCRYGTPIGDFARVLVLAADHLEETSEPLESVEMLMDKVTQARAARGVAQEGKMTTVLMP